MTRFVPSLEPLDDRVLFSAAPVGPVPAPLPVDSGGVTAFQPPDGGGKAQDPLSLGAEIARLELLITGPMPTDAHGSVTYERVRVDDPKAVPAGVTMTARWSDFDSPTPGPWDRARVESLIAHLADVVFSSRALFDTAPPGPAETPAREVFIDRVWEALRPVESPAAPAPAVTVVPVPLAGQVGVTGQPVGPVLPPVRGEVEPPADDRATPAAQAEVTPGVFAAVKLSGPEIATRAAGLLGDFLPADPALLDRAVRDLLDRLDAVAAPVEEWSPGIRATMAMAVATAVMGFATVAVNRECRERLAAWWPRLTAALRTTPERPGTTRV